MKKRANSLPTEQSNAPAQHHAGHQKHEKHTTFTIPPQYSGPTSYLKPGQVSVMVLPQGGWFSRRKRNCPQLYAVFSAFLILITGGMNIAWSVGIDKSLLMSNWERYSWFIGAIIGALFASCLPNKLPKKLVLQYCSTLVLIEGTVLVSIKRNLLLLGGIANGMTFVSTLALAGELAVSYMRGHNLMCIEQTAICFGLAMIPWISWTRAMGVCKISLGIAALIMSTFLTIESPVIMLANGEVQQAVHAQRRLQLPYIVTSETYDQLEQHKHYLKLNNDLTLRQSICQAWPAFLRLFYLRALNAMSLSHFVVFALFVVSLERYQIDACPYKVFGLSRLLGTFIAIISSDFAGRKKLSLAGLLACSCLSFAMGGTFQQLNFSVTKVLIFAFQLFAGIAFTPTAAYISEAYPLAIKQHCIGATFIAEMLVYIIIQVCDPILDNVIPAFFYVFGALSLIAFVGGILFLPETKGTTLREAQERFEGFGAKACNKY